jgi:hypothetical protein
MQNHPYSGSGSKIIIFHQDSILRNVLLIRAVKEGFFGQDLMDLTFLLLLQPAGHHFDWYLIMEPVA